MIHVLEQTQVVAAPLERVWAYFATPTNLNDMTPPELDFLIVRGATPVMRQGQLIEYQVKFAPGPRTTWLTEIRQVVEGRYFVDEQRIGPYRLWYHEHHFDPLPDGTVQMTDRVTYVVGWGLLGELLHAGWIRAKLERIFSYRRQRVTEVFATT
jgi:ligand-binding SRPBCC domain-containing protein